MKQFVAFIALCAVVYPLSAQWVSIGSTTTSNVYNLPGKIGIGYTSALTSSTLTAQLQLNSYTDNRQIVLNGTVTNPYQMAGFGYNSSTLKYIVPASTSDHVFYAASSSSGANELMRITGTGNVGIGTNGTAPIAKLQVVGSGIFSTSLSVGSGAQVPSGIAMQVTGQTLLNDFVGVNMTAPIPAQSALFTISGGDLRIIETNDYAKMPDGNGADLYLYDKVGGILDIFQLDNVGRIDMSSELRIGNSNDITKCMTVFPDGTVAIGAKSTGPLSRPAGYKLFVKDGIITEKVRIAFVGDATYWPDYVFSDNYSLQPLDEVKKYIKEYKHLPEIPSAKEVSENGIDVAQMEALLLKKIEELTLHMISHQKTLEKLQKMVE